MALPVFREEQNILLEVPGSHADQDSSLVKVAWPPTAALYLNRQGIFIARGTIRFICLLYPIDRNSGSTVTRGTRLPRATPSSS